MGKCSFRTAISLSLTRLPDAGLAHDGDPDLGFGAPPQVRPQELEGALARRRHLKHGGNDFTLRLRGRNMMGHAWSSKNGVKENLKMTSSFGKANDLTLILRIDLLLALVIFFPPREPMRMTIRTDGGGGTAFSQ